MHLLMRWDSRENGFPRSRVAKVKGASFVCAFLATVYGLSSDSRVNSGREVGRRGVVDRASQLRRVELVLKSR